MLEKKCSDLEAGDILYTDICMTNGMVVLQAKTVLSASHITRLQKLGMDIVEVYDAGTTEENLNKMWEEVVERKFEGYDQLPLMVSVKEILLRCLK